MIDFDQYRELQQIRNNEQIKHALRLLVFDQELVPANITQGELLAALATFGFTGYDGLSNFQKREIRNMITILFCKKHAERVFAGLWAFGNFCPSVTDMRNELGNVHIPVGYEDIFCQMVRQNYQEKIMDLILNQRGDGDHE